MNNPDPTTILEPNAAHSYDSYFSSMDADFVLRSSDGTLFRIPTYTLRTTSGFFRTMLMLPQRNNIDDFIPLDEPRDVVGPLLKMISGMEMPKWESVDELQCVLEAADKYEMAGPIATIRYILTSPRFLSEEPLRLYAIATRFDWHEEVKLAAERTLTLSICDAKHTPLLEQIPSKPLLKLLEFHRKRRDEFRRLINDPARFSTGNPDPKHCETVNCGLLVDNSPWRCLKSVMIFEMDMRPLGDTLLGTILNERPEATACWSAKCRGCDKLTYNRTLTLRGIQQCLDPLQASI
jgi:hypothetical protein